MGQPETYKSILHEHGLRATPARVSLLSVLDRKKAPLSVQEIQSKISPAVDESTVYRNLHTLIELGLVNELHLEYDQSHFEIASTGDHHHIICEDCGKIEELYICPIHKVEAAILSESEEFERISHHNMEFSGVCISCRDAK